VAMLDAMISYLWPEGMMQYTVVGAETAAADPNDRPDLVFKTSNGYITAGTISDSEWQGFCRASGDPELAKDPRFRTPSAGPVHSTPRPPPHPHRAHQQDGGINRPAHHSRRAGAPRPCRRALRADPAARRNHPQ